MLVFDSHADVDVSASIDFDLGVIIDVVGIVDGGVYGVVEDVRDMLFSIGADVDVDVLVGFCVNVVVDVDSDVVVDVDRVVDVGIGSDIY